MWQAPCTCPIPHHLCRSSSNSDCQVLAVTSTCAALFARTCPSLMPRCQALCGTKADPSRWWPQKLRTFVEKDSWGTSNPSLPVSHENKRPRVLASSSSAAAAAASGGTGGTKGQCLRGLMGPTLSSKAAAAAAHAIGLWQTSSEPLGEFGTETRRDTLLWRRSRGDLTSTGILFLPPRSKLPGATSAHADAARSVGATCGGGGGRRANNGDISRSSLAARFFSRGAAPR
mmetsp:Transcript_4097/g.13815  ORF Transcript_4097/g.13815 Transcript_4097/m.13815 type:complete len:230 (-) Transcript_4097:85-774(-)